MTLTIAVILVLTPFVLVAMLIDDWSRDLNTNTAATAPAAKDKRLRPVEATTTLQAADTTIDRFLDAHANWRRADEKPLPDDSPIRKIADGQFTVRHLVRSTSLWKFKDDVWVVIEDRGDGVLRLHGDSRSRLGKGDLGQNPRNLGELFGFLRDAFE
ncbi:hypothetical protein Pla108_27530 [Botrimarina colliarenosi]|uniref:DUF1499 domain-containing protein n=2 Tax=Botrimarina colliarenosi TaxID=2528001 RepID=A0A5C6AC33_9BACT|nr:hypothetical protein Pla108_27530 [Botrimarina colliarenosi]